MGLFSSHRKLFSNTVWLILKKKVSLWREKKKMMHYIQLLRPLQWLKNTFVFTPIFFSNHLLEMNYLMPTLIVFASFCLISSSIYCFNDLKDAEADRQHPQKCHRPIASGKVSVKGGYAMMAICLIGAFALLPLARSINTSYLNIIINKCQKKKN